jgi:hypothetical protein
MTTIIKDTDQFQLRGHLNKYGDDLYDFTLEQCWKVAQKPHFTRICQLNLNEADLNNLVELLLDR